MTSKIPESCEEIDESSSDRSDASDSSLGISTFPAGADFAPTKYETNYGPIRE